MANTKQKSNNQAVKTKRKYVKIKPEAFVKEYTKNGRNGTKAIQELDPQASEASAGQQAYRMLNKVETQLLLNQIEDKIKRNALKGIDRLGKLIDSDNDTIAYNASKDSVDRAGFTPVKKTQTVNINIEQYIEELV